MNYLERAISLAVEDHKGQIDKGGKPYILHPLHVMSKMESETEMIVAILHDVIEDTSCTLLDLKNEGFSSEIINAVACLTKGENEEYFSYIQRVKGNPLATKVKLADLEHNMDFKRIKNISDEDLIRRIKKYKKAWDILQL